MSVSCDTLMSLTKKRVFSTTKQAPALLLGLAACHGVMKTRSNERRREWNEIHRYNLEKRRESKRIKKSRRGVGPSRIDHLPEEIIECPAQFLLDENFEEVIQVLHTIRAYSEGSRRYRLYVDFRPIRDLSPAAALVLAAELDRWNRRLAYRKGGSHLQTRDIEEWDSEVRRLLGDMGFFGLLSVTDPVAKTGNAADTQYVHFRTGNKPDGPIVDRLREEDLEPLVGGKILNNRPFYNALTEAMINVKQHAYRQAERQTWWLSASYTKTTKELVIMIFDQGAGIPKTLNRTFREHAQRIVSTDHARLIKAAHEIDRSSSRQDNRGNGLQTDIRAYINKLAFRGQYRVTSLRGRYIWDKKGDGTISEELNNYRQKLNGTLIEWRIFL